MKTSAIILLLVLNSFLCRTSLAQSNSDSLLECPNGDGFRLLPNIYPAESVFIGYGADDFRRQILKEFILSVQKNDSQIKIHLLVKKQFLREAKNFTNQIKMNINFISMGDNVSWPQDIMSIGVNGSDSKAMILKLPYERGAVFADEIAHSLKMPLLFPKISSPQEGNNLGGNIVPFP